MSIDEVRDELAAIDGLVVVDGPATGGADLRAHQGDDYLRHVGVLLAGDDLDRRLREAETFSHAALVVVSEAGDVIGKAGVPVVTARPGEVADAVRAQLGA